MVWFYCLMVEVALRGTRFQYLPLDKKKIWLHIYYVKIFAYGRHSPICLDNIGEQVKSFSHLGVILQLTYLGRCYGVHFIQSKLICWSIKEAFLPQQVTGNTYEKVFQTKIKMSVYLMVLVDTPETLSSTCLNAWLKQFRAEKNSCKNI